VYDYTKQQHRMPSGLLLIMNKILISILFFLSTSLLFSNSIDLDSLLSKAKTDSQRAYAYKRVAKSYSTKEIEKVISNYTTALNYAKKTNNNLLLGDIKLGLGIAYVDANKLTNAKKMLNSAYYNYFTKSDDYGIANVYMNLGSIEYLKGNLISAHKYWEESLNLYKLLKNEPKIAGAYSNIAIIYSELNNNKKALENLFLASKILEKNNKKLLLTNMYNNIGGVYQCLKDYPNSIKYFNKSIYLKEILGDELGIAVSYTNLAIVYTENNDFKKGLEYSLKSIKIKKKYNYLKGLPVTYKTICDIYINIEQYDNALNYALEGLRISEDNSILKDEVSFNEYIYKIYDKKGEVDRANDYKKTFILLNDSLLKHRNYEKEKVIANEKRDTYILTDTVTNIVPDNTTQVKSSVAHYIIISSIIVALFIIGIIIIIVINRRKNKLT